MKSVVTDQFRKAFERLPKNIQVQARQVYAIWKNNHNHPGLHFKPIHKQQAIYSVRVGLSYRALGVMDNDTIVWFWIGSHETYNQLITPL